MQKFICMIVVGTEGNNANFYKEIKYYAAFEILLCFAGASLGITSDGFFDLEELPR